MTKPIECFKCKKLPTEGHYYYFDHYGLPTYRLTLSCSCFLVLSPAFRSWSKHKNFIKQVTQSWNNTIKSFRRMEAHATKERTQPKDNSGEHTGINEQLGENGETGSAQAKDKEEGSRDGSSNSNE